MNYQLKLSTSYMKKQKGKTISLLSCIIVAVILIFSMIVVRDSGYDSQIKEAKSLNGDYHVMFDNIDKIKLQGISNEKEISKLNASKELCNIVDKKSGVKLNLDTFNKGFIDSIGYKLEGRKPLKDGEIVIEKKASDDMGISNPINKNINLMLLNKYNDDNKINRIDSSNKTFKIVGIIEKADKYYATSSYGNTFRSFVYQGQKLPFKDKNTYTGTIYLKSEKNVSKFLDSMRKKFSINYNIYENAQVDLAKHFKKVSMFSRENMINLVILIVVSTIVIYNIFNIIFQDMTNQIGLMRSIGMSKKKVSGLFIKMSLIYVVLGTVIGLIVGIIFSDVGLRIVYGYNTSLTIHMYSIVVSFVVSIISVFISSLVIIKKSMKMSIIEAIKASDRYKKKSKNRSRDARSKNLIVNMAIRNLWRNKFRTILTMVAITVIGALFILNLGGHELEEKNMELGIMSGIGSMSYGSVDKTVEGDVNSSDYTFYKIGDNMIKKVRDVKGVKYVEPNFYNPQGYILTSKDKLSKAYKQELNRKKLSYNTEYNNEYPLLIRGFSDKMLRQRQGFIQTGQNILTPTSKGYKKVILVNNTSSKITASFDTKVIDHVKVGDIVDIKVPINRDGIEKYQNLKVEVGAIMKESYASGQDGNTQAEGAQVIFRENDYKEITGQKDYNRIFVTTEKGQVYPVGDRLKELTRNYRSTEIDGKGEELKFIGNKQSSEDKLSIIYQVLILIILSLNIIFIMRSNIIARRKELATLRAIGMNVKSIKRTLIIESLLYGVIASIIGTIIATAKYNYEIAFMNKVLTQGGYANKVQYGAPWIQIIVLFVIFIAIGIISVYVSRDKIKGKSIVASLSQSD